MVISIDTLLWEFEPQKKDVREITSASLVRTDLLVLRGLLVEMFEDLRNVFPLARKFPLVELTTCQSKTSQF